MSMESSGVPPPAIGSAIQTAQSQRQATDAARVDEARQAHAQRTQVARNEEMDSTVETTDAEMQVNTDGGGLGSQGREAQPGSEGEDAVEEEQSGITRDENGQIHLDLEV
ncbi:MAG: hypothetical protein JSU68_06595 [Phycisphaerales bacterium]|nr:MAG: hypothetical protein JSU68_06595 [Phycisphaerales bacterium]